MSAAPAQPILRPRRYVYTSALRWTGQKKGSLTAEDRPALEIATPVEFKGHPGIWSPEDLFVASASACLMTTFLALAGREQLGIVSYAAEAEGVLEWSDGALRFTSIVLRPSIVVAGDDVARTEALIEKAERQCLVAASMATPITLEASVTAA